MKGTIGRIGRTFALTALLVAAGTGASVAAVVRSTGDGGIPALTGPVVDEAGILDPATRSALTALALDVKQKKGAEIAVLTVRTTAPLDDFTYGMNVTKAWQLGSAEKDDGLLLLIAVDDRKSRFFSGYGLEGILPDGRLGTILDRFAMPHFRKGDFAAGARDAMSEIARVIETEYDGKGAPARQRTPGIPLWMILVLILFVIVMSRSRSMPATGRRRRRYAPIFWGGGFGAPMSGGFGGGFGGSGGGFGGGGGGFGGGGAGRSW